MCFLMDIPICHLDKIYIYVSFCITRFAQICTVFHQFSKLVTFVIFTRTEARSHSTGQLHHRTHDDDLMIWRDWLTDSLFVPLLLAGVDVDLSLVVGHVLLGRRLRESSPWRRGICETGKISSAITMEEQQTRTMWCWKIVEVIYEDRELLIQ